MGWGTSFYADMYISKKIFHSVNEIDQEIKSIENDIESERQTLLMYASSTPKDIADSDTDIIFDLKFKINESIETLHDLYNQLFKLEYLKESIENGKYKFGQDTV